MLKRLRRHLNPSLVISMIALFAALGGGYAFAFSGSGTLQKAHNFGIDSSYENVRTLNGIGSVEAKCNIGDGEVTVRLNNTSGKQLQFKSSTGDAVFLNSGTSEEYGPFQSDYIQLYAHPVFSGGAKNPQADINISVSDGSACSLDSVTVLALNSVE